MSDAQHTWSGQLATIIQDAIAKPDASKWHSIQGHLQLLEGRVSALEQQGQQRLNHPPPPQAGQAD